MVLCFSGPLYPRLIASGTNNTRWLVAGATNPTRNEAGVTHVTTLLNHSVIMKAVDTNVMLRIINTIGVHMTPEQGLVSLLRPSIVAAFGKIDRFVETFASIYVAAGPEQRAMLNSALDSAKAKAADFQLPRLFSALRAALAIPKIMSGKACLA